MNQANGDTLSASIAGMFNAPIEAKEPDDAVEPSNLTASITGLLGAADGASAPVGGSNHTPKASKLSSLQVPQVYAVNVTHHGETNSTSAPVVDEIKSLPMAKLIGADEDEEAKSTNSSSLNAAGAVVPTNSSNASVPTKTETPVNTSVAANTTVSLDARNEIKQLKQEVKEEIKREEAQKQQMRAQLKAELKAELKGEKKGEGASASSETSVNVLKDTVRDVVKEVVKKVFLPNTTNKTGWCWAVNIECFGALTGRLSKNLFASQKVQACFVRSSAIEILPRGCWSDFQFQFFVCNYLESKSLVQGSGGVLSSSPDVIPLHLCVLGLSPRVPLPLRRISWRRGVTLDRSGTSSLHTVTR